MGQGGATVKVHDKVFEKHLDASLIQKKVAAIAAAIAADFADKDPIFLAILNGSFLFASDIIRNCDIECEISFVKLASYAGDSSTGDVRFLSGLNENLTDRNIIILEDIIDSGLTILKLKEELQKLKPESIKVATLIFKPAALQYDVKPDYVGFELGNEFLIGYGLDYNGKGRQYNDIYKAV